MKWRNIQLEFAPKRELTKQKKINVGKGGTTKH